MKKALIILCFSVSFFLAGVFPAGISLEASSIPTITQIGKTGSMGFFHLNQAGFREAIIEYRFHEQGIVFSKLLTTSISNVSFDGSTYRYQFILPGNAESYRVWRVIKNETQSSVSGSHTFETSTTLMSAIQVRLKTIFIHDDLIIKKTIGARDAATAIVEFTLHFNPVDVLGNPIPIDYIHRARVEYDVVSKPLLGFGQEFRTHKVKDIQATTTIPMQFFPYVIPSSVIQNIKASNQSGYAWQIVLGQFYEDFLFWIDGWWGTMIDKTTVLEIDYYYNGYFYQDVPVVDEPYDMEDIVVIPPVTPEDLFPSIFKWILDNPMLAISIVVGILAFSLLARFLGALQTVFQFIGFILKGIGKVLGLILKTIGFILKFILFTIPKGILQFLYFLITPAEKRRERKAIHYVNRSL